MSKNENNFPIPETGNTNTMPDLPTVEEKPNDQELKNKLKEHQTVINYATDLHCRKHGEVVNYNGKNYYVNLNKQLVQEIKGKGGNTVVAMFKKLQEKYAITKIHEEELEHQLKFLTNQAKDHQDYQKSETHKIANQQFKRAFMAPPVSRILSFNEQAKVNAILSAFNALVTMAEELGYPLRVNATTDENMVLYFNDDYPDRILLDKELSNPAPLNDPKATQVYCPSVQPCANETKAEECGQDPNKERREIDRRLIGNKAVSGKRFLIYHMSATNLFNFLKMHPSTTVAHLEGSPDTMRGTAWDIVIIPNRTTAVEVEKIKEAIPNAQVMITEGLFRECGFTVDGIRDALNCYGYKFIEDDEGFDDEDDD